MHPGDRPADNVKMAGICRSRTPELTGAFSTPGCIEAATINARLHTSAGASRMLSAQCTCNDPSRGFVTVYVRIMPAAHVSNLCCWVPRIGRRQLAANTNAMPVESRVQVLDGRNEIAVACVMRGILALQMPGCTLLARAQGRACIVYTPSYPYRRIRIASDFFISLFPLPYVPSSKRMTVYASTNVHLRSINCRCTNSLIHAFITSSRFEAQERSSVA